MKAGFRIRGKAMFVAGSLVAPVYVPTQAAPVAAPTLAPVAVPTATGVTKSQEAAKESPAIEKNGIAGLA